MAGSLALAERPTCPHCGSVAAMDAWVARQVAPVCFTAPIAVASSPSAPDRSWSAAISR